MNKKVEVICISSPNR